MRVPPSENDHLLRAAATMSAARRLDGLGVVVERSVVERGEIGGRSEANATAARAASAVHRASWLAAEPTEAAHAEHRKEGDQPRHYQGYAPDGQGGAQEAAADGRAEILGRVLSLSWLSACFACTVRRAGRTHARTTPSR